MAEGVTDLANLFLSYHFGNDEEFVLAVSYQLRRQPSVRTFTYAQDRRAIEWPTQIASAISDCTGFVCFVGKEIGKTQEKELLEAEAAGKQILVAFITRHPARSFVGRTHATVSVDAANEDAATTLARMIAMTFELGWVSADDLPIGYPFDYEKAIVQEYQHTPSAVALRKRQENGLPISWPEIVPVDQNMRGKRRTNPASEAIIGSYKPLSEGIIVDARTSALRGKPLVLPEASPRQEIYYPREGSLKVGVLVSGGVAPGTNAVIAGIVRQHKTYHREATRRGRGYALSIEGFVDGFKALLTGEPSISLLDERIVLRDNEGGSVLGTSRVEKLLPTFADSSKRERSFQQVVRSLHSAQLDILYVIGGDGSMRAAHAIWTRANDPRADSPPPRPLSVVGIPKTMDNDVLWSFRSLGFSSAVEKARELVSELATEAASNSRVYVVQLFGSDSGFVVCDVALATHACAAILVPESNFYMETLSAHICSKLEISLQYFRDQRGVAPRPHAIVLMAETAIPLDIKRYINDDRYDLRLTAEEFEAVQEFVAKGRRVMGHTPDALRPVGLKVVCAVLQTDIKRMAAHDAYWNDYLVRSNEPRHAIRAVAPIVLDVVVGQRLGALAVDNAMAGFTDFMVSQWLTEYVLVPLKLVVLGRKRVPRGYFWRAAMASTNQPDLSKPPRRRRYAPEVPARTGGVMAASLEQSIDRAEHAIRGSKRAPEGE